MSIEDSRPYIFTMDTLTFYRDDISTRKKRGKSRCISRFARWKLTESVSHRSFHPESSAVRDEILERSRSRRDQLGATCLGGEGVSILRGWHRKSASLRRAPTRKSRDYERPGADPRNTYTRFGQLASS